MSRSTDDPDLGARGSNTPYPIWIEAIGLIVAILLVAGIAIATSLTR